MNLLMIATSLEMRNVGHSFEASTYVIQGHVLAMFGPSLISGLLIRWLRRDRFVALGMILMALAALTALHGPGAVGLYHRPDPRRTGVELPVHQQRQHGRLARLRRREAAGAGDQRHAGVEFLGGRIPVGGRGAGDFRLVGLQIVALVLLVPLIVFGVLVRFGGTGLSRRLVRPAPEPMRVWMGARE